VAAMHKHDAENIVVSHGAGAPEEGSLLHDVPWHNVMDSIPPLRQTTPHDPQSLWQCPSRRGSTIPPSAGLYFHRDLGNGVGTIDIPRFVARVCLGFLRRFEGRAILSGLAGSLAGHRPATSPAEAAESLSLVLCLTCFSPLSIRMFHADSAAAGILRCGHSPSGKHVAVYRCIGAPSQEAGTVHTLQWFQHTYPFWMFV
jgi:hypothetical protein